MSGHQHGTTGVYISGSTQSIAGTRTQTSWDDDLETDSLDQVCVYFFVDDIMGFVGRTELVLDVTIWIWLPCEALESNALAVYSID